MSEISRQTRLTHGLYILFEGLPATVIDAQVMRHVRHMREAGIVDFEVWAFAHSADLYERSIHRLEEVQSIAGGTVRVIWGIKPAFPFSALLNAFLLWVNITKLHPTFSLIHARTDYSTAVCGYLRLVRSFRLIWDCRGDSEAEFLGKYPRSGFLQRMVILYQIMLMRWRAAWAGMTCQSAIFVTDILRIRLGKTLGRKSFQIIPTAVADGLFYFDPKLRKATRDRLGYHKDDSVLIYSGSLAYYQCFSECIEVFKSLRQQNPRTQLLVLTPEVAAARQEIERVATEGIQVLSAHHDEVNAYLNAADYAFLLREHSPLNDAAFPTKFAEYGMAGLPVIMRRTPPDAYNLAQEIGNLCEYQEGTVDFSTQPDRAKVSESYQRRLTRSAVTEQYRTLYLAP
jgi:glycosyltransferase involved in cell wall biosynthesis